MNGLGGLNKSPNGVVIGLVQLQLPVVVTKADLGAPADRARRDLQQAVGAVGAGQVPVLAVSCIPPPAGVEELVEALDAHGQSLDPQARRPRARPSRASITSGTTSRACPIRASPARTAASTPTTSTRSG